MNLGLVTYNWGKDWDLPTLIKNCQQTGFLGVELRSTHKHGVEPTLSKAQRQDVAKRFADSQVQLVGLGTACEYHSPDASVLAKQIEETKAFIDLCHDCGGSGIKVRPNGLPADVPIHKTLNQIGQALRTVAEYGEGFGVQIRLEVHGKGTAELPHIKAIMEAAAHPNAKVCWNSNPNDLNGAGLEANFAMVQKYLGDTIHVHDLTSDYPWRPLIALLKKANYTGWALVEEGADTADPIRVMNYYRLLWEQWTA